MIFVRGIGVVGRLWSPRLIVYRMSGKIKNHPLKPYLAPIRFGVIFRFQIIPLSI